MKVLIVPMFALSTMGGPWSRAQKIDAAFRTHGHHVCLGIAEDGNCSHPESVRTLELPAPSPLGLPMVIASKTFPLASKLGIMGRKPVHSFEEVLWLTGNLARSYEEASVSALRTYIREEKPDVIYSEFSIPAILAGKAEGIPVVGSHSFPTQSSYAADPQKSKGLRKYACELGLPKFNSALDLFRWMDARFIPSCIELEPISGPDTHFCGLLSAPLAAGPSAERRDAIVFYLGSGSVPAKRVREVAAHVARELDCECFVAGIDCEEPSTDKLHFGKRFDFDELLPRAAAFVNHGGQNSIADGLRFGAPQVICPGKIFERQYNAQSIHNARAGVALSRFDEESVLAAIRTILADSTCTRHAALLRTALGSLGGADTIIRETERIVLRNAREAAQP